MFLIVPYYRCECVNRIVGLASLFCELELRKCIMFGDVLFEPLANDELFTDMSLYFALPTRT